jgi:hypothetical protein
LAQPAFCETFDQSSVNGPANSRAGQLDGVLWGTSMVTGSNPGDGIATTVAPCGAGNANYPGNIGVCNGQLVDSVNDGGTVTSLAMYPRQPFDFAGRTGTIAFDVSNDSQGTHAAWPELWVTDQPVPDPFTHEASWQSQPRNGFGVRFAGCSNGTCPDGNNGVGVDSAVVVNNYLVNDSFNGGSLQVSTDQDVIKSGPGQMNHYQVAVSQTQIDVYGTNPFTGTWNPAANPLRHISTISGFRLGFTRGLVWLEDVHYNGNKFNSQGTHSFHWDNLGFDGPVLPRDLGFDVPNNNTPDSNVAGGGVNGLDDAYTIPANGSRSLTIPAVTNLAQASGALLEFNFYSQAVIPLQVALNGNNLTIPWPYPDTTTFSPRTIAIPVPLTDVTTGNNTVTFTAGNYLFEVDNIDLILPGAGGTVNP